MPYCHECGSEVAENNAFCPYCGITLQPVTVAESDNLQNNHVIVQESENAFGQSENNESQSKEFAEDEKSFGAIAENYSNDLRAEKSFSKTEIGEAPEIFAERHFSDEEIHNVPTPEKTEILKPEGEDLTTGKETETKPVRVNDNVKTETENEITETQSNNWENVIPVIDDKEKIAETLNESSLSDYEEAEVKEGQVFEEAELSFKEVLSNNEENAGFNVTEPNFLKDFESPRNSVTENCDTNQPEEFFDNNRQLASETESENFTSKPIAKPEAELETPESQSQPHRFDSVRIFEKRENVQKQPEDLEFSAQSQNQTQAENEPQQQTEQKIERSFTTPNIGIGDTDGKKASKLKPLDEGTVLNGRYEIVRKIGGGGMGAVYLASDRNLGGVLRAVKEMVQSYIEGEQQEKAVNDFKRESLLLTSLEHQSIPTIYDYFYDEKEARFYLVMKYISGGDLASRLRSTPEGRIDEQSVTEWAIQIADVLDYLHNRQPPIVYRDLKPANIMIDGNTGRVMLIDFGIARWVNKEEKGVTAVGTMGYAPPELFSGNVEPRSDIYSLGSTIFHLLTGADPQSNPLLIFDFQKNPRPRQINPQLSDQMERILMRAVEYNADKRFTSAAELRTKLEEHLKKLKANNLSYGVKDVPESVSLSDQPVFCGFCGQKIIATDLFCAFCGAKQPLAQQGVRSEKSSSASTTAQLLIVGTNELEVPAFTIEKDSNLVGRRDPMLNIFPEVDLSKYDPQTKISRKHARIWREGNEFMVEDLGSSNGTIILPVVHDTVRLQPHQPYVLTNGDKLRLGDTTLHFVIS